MKFRPFLGLLLAGLLPSANLPAATPADGDSQWLVTLLKPTNCGGCSFLEESLKRRGMVQNVTLSDGGASVTARVERRVGGTVAAAEWEEIRALPSFDEAAWHRAAGERSVQVLLKREGHVVAAGPITESIDPRDARFPLDLTTPLDGVDPAQVLNGYNGFWQQHFVGGWNLDWFYRVARNPAVAGSRRFANWVMQRPQRKPLALGTTNVLLASTARGAYDNPVFNAIRTEQIEGLLVEQLGLDRSRIQVRYGAGVARGHNAVETMNGDLRFVHRELPRAQPLTLDSLAAFFEGVRERPGARNLLVLIGHGGPEGAPLWGEVAPLGLEEMQWLHEHGRGDDVMVSGNCFGGILAQAVSCGFFGARPDVVATGCQSNAREVEESQDYLRLYFQAFEPGRRVQADVDHDGKVSFEEAHWFATRFGDERNITFSTVDALAEHWFGEHPDALPEDISLVELQALAKAAGPGESETLKTLSRALTGTHRFPLKDLATQAERYAAVPAGPRPMIAQLARRMIYLSRAGANAELTATRACGARSPAEFLKP
ncbi:MAG: hypothetical protein RLZZ200_434 [Pseudomonadota bacterium]|jgi:hypothetical protein